MMHSLFRGYSRETSSWYVGYGFFVNKKTKNNEEQLEWREEAILLTKKGPVEVDFLSVGQYATTVKDIELVTHRLFAGDIIRFRYVGEKDGWSRPLVVEWGGDDYPAFDLKGHAFDDNLLSLIVSSGEYEVQYLGNHYQKPDML